jgi:anaerobic C4-dicarboxylate transporter DcuB
MLPIIYDIAIKNNFRPERPMAASSVASQMGILTCPVSVAVVSLVAFLSKAPVAGQFIDFIMVLSITIPLALAGVLAIGVFSWFRGKDLDYDEKFQRRIADPEQREFDYGESSNLMGKILSSSQWAAMWIFIGTIVMVAFLGAFQSLRPLVSGTPLSMVLTIQMFMLLAGALMILFKKLDPSLIGKTEMFRASMIAVVAVFGIAWMADTAFEAHRPELKATLTELVKTQPWTYAIALLLVSKLVNSQAAAISAMVPVGLAIGVPPGYVVAFAPATYGYHILPAYPSDLAAVQFDRSGTTHIGKYLINHSFIVPGLIWVSTFCLAGYLLASAHAIV